MELAADGDGASDGEADGASGWSLIAEDVLCEANVSVVIFSSSGKLTEYCSPNTTLPRILEKYQTDSGHKLWDEKYESKEECEYLIEKAKPYMVKSSVVDSTTGKGKDSRVRTSSGMFLKRGQDKIVRVIEKRIADYSFIPIDHGEGLQVLHYEVGQKYKPHFDYFLDEFNIKNGGQRMATLLMYLSDVEEGGETVFPNAKTNGSSSPWYNELSECGKNGLGLKPNMGDALLFWSMKPDATMDPLSLHGSCPVLKGNKWSCTKWMRVHEYK